MIMTRSPLLALAFLASRVFHAFARRDDVCAA